jgi:hypothetical protein
MRRRTFLTAALVALPGFALAQNAQRPPLITAQNELERAFLAALQDETQRTAFRREFLVSQVAVAMTSDASDSTPREIQLAPELRAGAIFTSASRMNGVLGPAAARRVMTGRAALTLLRGKNVVLNYRLAPMLTLEPSDVTEWLGS